MTLLLGMIASRDGASIKQTVNPTRNAFTLENSYYRCRAADYEARQPPYVGVDIAHRGIDIGEAIYFCQRQAGLFALLDVDPDALPDGELYLSAEAVGRYDGTGYTDLTLRKVSIVGQSATVHKDPAVIIVGSIGSIGDACYFLANSRYERLLRDAAMYVKGRRWREHLPHVIAADPAAVEAPPVLDRWSRDRRNGFRTSDGGEVLAVRY